MTIIFTDADNTLWDTDAVYRRAHLWLFNQATRSAPLEEIADPVAFVRAIDQELAESHPAHLRYPPSMLVQRLIQQLPGGGAVPSDVLVNEIAGEFSQMTTQLPILREGVKEGLQSLHALKYPVHVITETNAERCALLLQHHNIAEYVESVDSVRKNEGYFQNLKRQLPSNAVAWVVGDQLTRDIIPARSAGFRTIYFPSSFSPRWEESSDVDSGSIQIITFADVPVVVQDDPRNLIV